MRDNEEARRLTIIVKDERYRESLALYLQDKLDQRVIYVPANPKEIYLDIKHQEDNSVFIETYLKSHVSNSDGGTSYNEDILNTFRRNFDIIITESLENELAAYAYAGGGTFYADISDENKKSASRPLDSLIDASAVGFNIVLAIDSESTHQAIKTLYDALYESGKYKFPLVLSSVYSQGKKSLLSIAEVRKILE